MRVFGWQTLTRNESESIVSLGGNPACGLHHRPTLIFWIDLSKSIYVGTRKMVNYA